MKLVTRTEALEMKDAWLSGKESQSDIAKRYNAMGYTTRKGTPLKNFNISWNITRNAKGRRASKVKTVPVFPNGRTTETVITAESIMLSVIQSVLTPEQKINVLSVLVK